MCRTRWIHPHIYDWPEPGAEDDLADLPLVGWRAGYANDVADALDAAFENAQGRKGEIQQGLDTMWAFLANAPPKSRAAAARTFASLAALRMIARLGAFEVCLAPMMDS